MERLDVHLLTVAMGEAGLNGPAASPGRASPTGVDVPESALHGWALAVAPSVSASAQPPPLRRVPRLPQLCGAGATAADNGLLPRRLSF